MCTTSHDICVTIVAKRPLESLFVNSNPLRELVYGFYRCFVSNKSLSLSNLRCWPSEIINYKHFLINSTINHNRTRRFKWLYQLKCHRRVPIDRPYRMTQILQVHKTINYYNYTYDTHDINFPKKKEKHSNIYTCHEKRSQVM